MNDMTIKERLLAALKGNEVDKTPWSPFLAYWWDYQSEELTDKGQVKVIKSMGGDPLLRGFGRVCEYTFNKCSITTNTNGKHRIIRYETPVGILELKHEYSSLGNTWYLVEHPVKSVNDLKTLAYLHEDLSAVPLIGEIEKQQRDLEDDGLIVPVIGTPFVIKSSFQSLIEYWCGTVELTYMIYDNPEAVRMCLDYMAVPTMESAKIASDSNTEAFIFWEDSSTTNYSPAFFKEYASDEISSWGRVLHKNNKLLIHHACGHIKGLLPEMAVMPIDAIESLTPPPTGDIEPWEAADIAKGKCIIGGIEPVFFLNCTLDELEFRCIELLDKMKNKPFILANSDSCPPGVSWEKFLLVSKVVEEYYR